MKVEYINVNDSKMFDESCCACIGNFDGIHRGHQTLIQEAITLSEKYECKSAMITFSPDPEVTITGKTDIVHITSLEERIRLAGFYGIEMVYVLQFDQSMAALDPYEFIHKVLKRISLRALVCGFDFHFGKFGKGDAEYLQNNMDFEVVIKDEKKEAGEKISSTRIIKCIRNGGVSKAEMLLGHPYTIEGIVRTGRQLGRTIGFPTANVSYDCHAVLPKVGVYACWVELGGKRYMAMVNLGHNPTFNYTEPLSLEAHILDFDMDIYGAEIRVEFKEFLRDEMRFEGADQLKNQLNKDILSVRKLLKGNYES